MSYDNACKFLAENYPGEFVRWLLATETDDIELLKTELLQEPIRADALTFLKASNRILHLEFQTLPGSKPALPFRMLDYSVRLKREYGTTVEQVVVFLKQTASDAAFVNFYQDQTTTHRYRVVRLWEHAPDLFLASDPLLPFATLAQANSPPDLLREVAERLARIEDRQQRANLISCTEILAGLRFEKNLIHQLLREDLMRESVIYQEILQEGLQEGRQQGLQEGRQEGRQEGLQEGRQQGLQQGQREEALSLVTRLLSRRLGALEPLLQERVQNLALGQLEVLAEALLDFTQASDLVAWLESFNGGQSVED